MTYVFTSSILGTCTNYQIRIFRRPVLGCIEAHFYVHIFMFSGFSRSTRYTLSTHLCIAPIQNLQSFCKKLDNVGEFSGFLHRFAEFHEKSVIFRQDFHGILSECLVKSKGILRSFGTQIYPKDFNILFEISMFQYISLL